MGFLPPDHALPFGFSVDAELPMLASALCAAQMVLQKMAHCSGRGERDKRL
jgi:hypothetical protein